MTIKTSCTNALEEIGGVEVPDSFVGSTNITAKLVVSLATREGAFLAKGYCWDELVLEHTFTTIASQLAYGTGDGATDGFPSDFHKFSNLSQWDRTNFTQMQGPVSPGTWQFLNSSVSGTVATITRWFRKRGTELIIFPTPTVTGDTIAYSYYSKNWVKEDSASGALVANIPSHSPPPIKPSTALER